MKKTKIVWVTKYALTEGIIEARVEEMDGRYVHVYWPGGYSGRAMFVFGKDAFDDLDLAWKKTEDMREKKIISLKRQIKKLENQEIKVVKR